MSASQEIKKFVLYTLALFAIIGGQVFVERAIDDDRLPDRPNAVRGGGAAVSHAWGAAGWDYNTRVTASGESGPYQLRSPYLWFWLMDDDSPRPTGNLGPTELTLAGWVLPTPEVKGYMSVDETGVALIAPFRECLYEFDACDGTPDSVLAKQHLAPIRGHLAELIRLYGPIRYYRSADHRAIVVEYHWRGEPTLYAVRLHDEWWREHRGVFDGFIFPPLESAKPRVEFWFELTEATFSQYTPEPWPPATI